MNPIGNKFISLFLVLFLMMLSINLYAKERRGAKLLITKKNGQQIGGELITVKPNSLLLLNNEGKDVSINIEEIKVIRIGKKSKALRIGIVGFLVGAGLGALVGYMTLYEFLEGYNPKRDGSNVAVGAMIGGCIGAISGVLLGVVEGDKIIHFEGMTDLEIRDTLGKLRKKARVRDYK